MAIIQIDPTVCARCGHCVSICSESVLTQLEKDGIPESIKERLCIHCGHCVAICPHNALTHDEFPEGTVTPIQSSLLPAYEQVLEMLRSRRSLRVFNDNPIENDVLEKVLEAARFAPSAHNYQTTSYIVIQNRAVLNEVVKQTVKFYTKLTRQLRNPIIRVLFRLIFSKSELNSALHLIPDFELLADALRNGDDPVLHGAPCLIIAHTEKNVNFPETNAALALHNATFAAQSLGLGGFLNGYITSACRRNPKLRSLFPIPKGHEVFGAMALGYPKLTFDKWVERKPLSVQWI